MIEPEAVYRGQVAAALADRFGCEVRQVATVEEVVGLDVDAYDLIVTGGVEGRVEVRRPSSDADRADRTLYVSYPPDLAAILRAASIVVGLAFGPR